MRATSIVVALGSVLSTFAIGCSIEPIRLGDDSSGELGRARFEFQSSECTFGCSLDRPALAESMVTVIARVDDAAVVSARLASGSLSRISRQSESCTCATASGSTMNVEPTATCPRGDTKSCQLSIDIETKATGDDRIEILEASGAVHDSVMLHVRAAARIELTVTSADQPVAPGSDGVYVLKKGARVELASKVLAADGAEVVFTEHGVSHSYGDPTVLKPDTKVILGATDVEYMSTGRAAETSVVVSAPGATTTARFRVTL